MNRPIPWTLQRYIFREMGKTFLLTALALTAVLSLGGGVLEMTELGEVTPGQLLRLLGLLLPVAMALTLPIAALFSAAATYGRLSADNEFIACRSGGINLHVLFLPCVVLSLASAGVTFALINFLIPGMVRNLNEFIGGDIATFIEHRLSRPRGITLGGHYRIYADRSSSDPANPDRVALHRVAFVEIDGAEWARYGTAGEIDLRFERDDRRIRAAGAMSDVTFFDRRAGRFVDLAEQTIPANDLPTLLPMQIKFLTLPELFHYHGRPMLWHEVDAAIAKLRTDLGRKWVVDDLWKQWTEAKQFQYTGGKSRFAVQAKEARLIVKDGSIELSGVRVEERDAAGQTRTYEADRAVVEVTKGDQLSDCAVRIEVFDVKVRSAGGIVERAKEFLGPTAVAADWIRKVDALSVEELLHAATPPGEDDPLKERRSGVVKSIGGTVRRITATLVERAAFSVSVLVLVILSARALGIIFRGAHVVVAFGISFVPSLLVILTIVMGKQLALNAGTHVAGIIVMAAGLIVVALLDAWTLTKVLRR